MSEWTDSLNATYHNSHTETILHDVVSWMDYNNCICVYWSIYFVFQRWERTLQQPMEWRAAVWWKGWRVTGLIGEAEALTEFSVLNFGRAYMLSDKPFFSPYWEILIWNGCMIGAGTNVIRALFLCLLAVLRTDDKCWAVHQLVAVGYCWVDIPLFHPFRLGLRFLY